jgi:hypothetical protein
VLEGARQRGCHAVSPRTAVNTFSLPCVTYYARQRTVSCVAFFQSARQSSLPGKNEPGALCRALWENTHGKGSAVPFPPFAVRRRRTAKSAIPVVGLYRRRGCWGMVRGVRLLSVPCCWWLRHALSVALVGMALPPASWSSDKGVVPASHIWSWADAFIVVRAVSGRALPWGPYGRSLHLSPDLDVALSYHHFSGTSPTYACCPPILTNPTSIGRVGVLRSVSFDNLRPSLVCFCHCYPQREHLSVSQIVVRSSSDQGSSCVASNSCCDLEGGEAEVQIHNYKTKCSHWSKKVRCSSLKCIKWSRIRFLNLKVHSWMEGCKPSKMTACVPAHVLKFLLQGPQAAAKWANQRISF